MAVPEGTPWDRSPGLGQEAERGQEQHQLWVPARGGVRSTEGRWAQTGHCRRVLQEEQGVGWVALWEISPSSISHSLPEAKGLWIPLPASSQHRISTLGTLG